MNVFAGSGTTGGSRSSGSDNRGQKILLAVLVVVFVVLLVIQVPRLLDDGSSGSEPSGDAAVTEIDAAAAAAAAAAAQSADQAVQPGSPVVGSATTGVASSPAVRAREVRLRRWIRTLPSRDPFAPPVGVAAAAAAETSTGTPTTEPPAATTPTAPAVPAVPPTAAVIWTNGKRQVVGIREVFQVGDASFRLVSVNGATATVSVVGGSFAGGNRQITLDRARRVTIEDDTTGVRYILRFSQPMAAVPAEASTSG